jgi:rod shape-determining protein MreC
VPRNRSLRLAALGSTVQRAAAPAYSSSRTAGARALRRRLVAGVLVAVSLVLITGYFRESESGALHEVQGVAASILHPFQVGAERVARPFQDAYGWTADFFHAKSENARLKDQLREAQLRVIQNETAAQENRELREALGYVRGRTFPADYEQVPAEVITFGTGEYQQGLVISAGREDGVRQDDPVVDGSGWLVGIISKATPDTARVTLLTDPSFAVAGRDVQTGTLGLVRHGQSAGESLVFDLVPKDKVVQPRDLIATAGRRSDKLASLYPSRIPIGTVTSVNQTDVDIHQTVQIAPLADFSSLNTVLVLVPEDRQR